MKETTRPTFQCTEVGCGFVTTASSAKGRQKAIARHCAETGHTALKRIQYDEDPQELNF